MCNEIPKCPICGETLEIVIRGMPILDSIIKDEEKGFRFYLAGCCITGYEQTEFICQNCYREFDEDKKEINSNEFIYLNKDDILEKRPEKFQ